MKNSVSEKQFDIRIIKQFCNILLIYQNNELKY